jgi:hypothetical protein
MRGCARRTSTAERTPTGSRPSCSRPAPNRDRPASRTRSAPRVASRDARARTLPQNGAAPSPDGATSPHRAENTESARAPHGSHTTGRGQMAGTPAIGRSARTGERLLLRSLEESHTQAERAAAAARIPWRRLSRGTCAGADTDTDDMRTTQIPRDMSEEHGRDQLRQPSRRARSCCSRAW